VPEPPDADTSPPEDTTPPADEPEAVAAAVLPPGDPFGNLESVVVGAGTVTASGWALDPDTTDPIIVQMYVDWSANTMAWADLPRPDVEDAFAMGADHGFSLSMVVAPGAHTVCVYAVNVGVGASTAVGCRTVRVLGGNPVGAIDSVAMSVGTVTVSGWALDPDTTAPIIVQMYVDWSANTMAWADLPRPDLDEEYGLGPDHGFSLTMSVSPGTHTVCVYAINVGPGSTTSIGCRTVTVLGSNPVGNIDSVVVSDGVVTANGWALDADTTGPIIVQMYVDWSANTMAWADLPRPDVEAVFGLGSNHGFTLSLPVDPGVHTVCVYAINTGPGTTTVLGCRTVVVGTDCSVQKCVALTFDDGPGPYTSRLLDILQSTGTRATFFLVGERISGYPSVVRRMGDLGMEVSNHSWNHADLTTLTTSQIAAQLSQTSAAIESVTGRRPTLMRPPYGARNTTVDAVAGQQGLAVILWSLDTLDWKYPDPARIRSVVATGAVDGTIVLMHDIHSTTVDAVPGIIADLRARGFTLVTVTELLGSPRPGVVYSHG